MTGPLFHSKGRVMAAKNSFDTGGKSLPRVSEWLPRGHDCVGACTQSYGGKGKAKSCSTLGKERMVAEIRGTEVRRVKNCGRNATSSQRKESELGCSNNRTKAELPR